MQLTRLLNSPTGRLARALLGILLVFVDLAIVHGVVGGILGLAGLALLGAALFDSCFLDDIRRCCTADGGAYVLNLDRECHL